MHSMSMIDTNSKAYEAIVPAKPSEPKTERFNKVLNDKQEPRAQQARQKERAEKPAQAEKPEQAEKAERAGTPEPAASSERTAGKKEVAGQKPLRPGRKTDRQQIAGKAPEQQAVQAVEVVEPQVQQLLVNLLKTIANGETPETVEEFGSIEEMLTQLVQQLDSGDLQGSLQGQQGEQILAGIDLSTLVEQLQAISAEEGGAEKLTQLVSGLAEQLNADPLPVVDASPVSVSEPGGDAALLENAEQIAAAMPGVAAGQNNGQLAVPLREARQILQKALDTVTAQKQPGGQQVVGAEEEVDAEALQREVGTEEKIDPRFANLLKPRNQNQPSLREQVRGNNAKPAAAAVQAPVAAGTGADAVLNPEKVVEQMTDLLGSKPQQKMDNVVAQLQGNPQQQNPQVATGRTMPATAALIQTPSGQQVAESQIFDQVVSRMSGSFNGQSGKMVLRLQPGELGSLKLELIVEGDKVRASLVAQSQQVQEVLERNLPQLRNALAEQGLKIDQFQVDVDQRQDQQGQFEQQAQQQQGKQDGQQPGWQQDWQSEEQDVPLAHLMQNGGGGISLHV